jgi:hypothetical protein
MTILTPAELFLSVVIETDCYGAQLQESNAVQPILETAAVVNKPSWGHFFSSNKPNPRPNRVYF